MTLVDDATSRTLGRLGTQETIWAAVDVLRRWIEAYGVPHALYTDWKNVYVRSPTQAEQAAGTVPLTQFGRMCAALDIRIIAANSPQATGRVERNHGTQQDRLVKKLRLLGIADAATANAFLATTHWPEHNARFARPATSADDFHRRAPGRMRLDAVFQLEHHRVLSNDWVVQYATRCFQLVRQSGQPPARRAVLIRETATGVLDICYRGRRMQWTELPAAPRPARAPRPVVVPRVPCRPSADHPWNRDTRPADEARARSRAEHG